MASELYVETLKGLTSGANANKVIVPAGQTLYAPGHVIQVVHNLSTSLTALATGNTWTDANDFSVTITPTSANSFILIDVSFRYGSNAADSNSVRLTRNGVALALGANQASNLLGNVFTSHSGAVQGGDTFKTLYKDDPNTTSAVTYQIQVQNGSEVLYINSRNDGNTNDCQQYGYIAAWEIAG